MSGIEIEDEGGGEVRRIEGENKKASFLLKRCLL